MENKKVLIVDDEIDFGFVMKEFFIKKGFKVFLANSIAKGLNYMQQEKPDLLLLDNKLPDGLGWSKIEFILENFPGTQVVLISAWEVPKTTSPLFRIVQKPFIKEELPKMFMFE